MTSDRHQVIPRVMSFIFSEDKSEVVLMKASDEKDFAGKYDPPGGHIEKGESIIGAAEREISEETGIEPRSTKLRGIIHVSNFFGKEIMLFITESLSEKVDLVEHREGFPEWISIQDLDQINVLE